MQENGEENVARKKICLLMVSGNRPGLQMIVILMICYYQLWMGEKSPPVSKLRLEQTPTYEEIFMVVWYCHAESDF